MFTLGQPRGTGLDQGGRVERSLGPSSSSLSPLSSSSYSWKATRQTNAERQTHNTITQVYTCLNNLVERQGKANKSTTPRAALPLPWVGFEPTTLYSLGERATKATQLVGVRIYNTTQGRPQTRHSTLSLSTYMHTQHETRHYSTLRHLRKTTQHNTRKTSNQAQYTLTQYVHAYTT